MQIGIGIGVTFGGTSSADADAQAWAIAVTANSGTYSASTFAALSALIARMKAAGLWTKMACFNPMCGDQLAACLVQYKGGSWAPATNVNFVSGDYTEATGLTGNGSTKYLNTGLVPSTSLTLNDTHLSVYNRSSGASAAGGVHVGSINSTTQELFLSAPLTDGGAYSDQYTNSAASGRATVAGLASPYGFVVGSRTSSTAHSIYRNAASIVSNVSASTGTLPSTSVYVFAQNSGSPAFLTSHVLAAYSIGAGLSAADVTAYNADMQAFQTALGRNV